MKTLVLIGFSLLCATLAGCAMHPAGCSGAACERPDSNDRELVIWWPEDMRPGLDTPQRTQDFTVVPLRD